MKPDCDDKEWEFRPNGINPLSLHKFEEVEVIENCTVQILKCKICGKLSIGFVRGGKENLYGSR